VPSLYQPRNLYSIFTKSLCRFASTLANTTTIFEVILEGLKYGVVQP
jgi:hypothetical protein